MSRSSASSASLIGAIVNLHTQIETAKYLAVISCTMLLYDWVTSIYLEVAYIWGTPWSVGRVAYHFNRFWTMLVLFTTLPALLFSPSPDVSTCKQLLMFYGYGNAIELSIICGVFLMRCWALYNQRRVLVALSAGLTFTIIFSLVLIKVLVDQSVFLPNLLPRVFTGCLIVVPSKTWTLYIVPILFDATMFALMVYKICKLSETFGSTPLMQRLVKHGGIHSAVLISIIIFSCIGGANEAVKIAANGSGILAASSSIVCSRVIFSLHMFSEDERRKRLPVAVESTTVEDFKFVAPMSVVVDARVNNLGFVQRQHRSIVD